MDRYHLPSVAEDDGNSVLVVCPVCTWRALLSRDPVEIVMLDHGEEGVGHTGMIAPQN